MVKSDIGPKNNHGAENEVFPEMYESGSLGQDFFERNKRLDVISSSEKEELMKKLLEINVSKKSEGVGSLNIYRYEKTVCNQKIEMWHLQTNHPSTPERQGTAPKSRPLYLSITPQRVE